MGVMGDGSWTQNTSASSECGSSTADFLVVLPNKQIADPTLYHILIISVSVVWQLLVSFNACVTKSPSHLVYSINLKEHLKEADIVFSFRCLVQMCVNAFFFKIHITVFDALVHLNNILDAPHIPG